MSGSYDPVLVAVSILLAIMSAYAALDLAGRVTTGRTPRTRSGFLGLGAIAMGIGIWSMHYIGMLAYRMPMAVEYDWPTVLLSMTAAVGASALALYAVSRRTLSYRTTALGSLFMGGGIAAMHYIGMAAMRVPYGRVYSVPLVVASVVAAVVISFVALRLTFLSRHVQRAVSWRKAISATVMGLAIPVTHYMGMASVRFDVTVKHTENLHHAISISDLGTASIALVTVVMLCMVFVSTMLDRRFSRHAEERDGSEQRYRRILTANFDAFVATDESGIVTDWNTQATATFGWSTDEVVGTPIEDMLELEQPVPGQTLLSLATWPEEVRLRGRVLVSATHKTGIRFPAEMAISEINIAGERTFAAFIHDVTERQQVERSMEEARGSAEAANRAKSEFLANMSHEIRTPLNGVIGMTELALETELTPEQREYLETVKFSADSLLTVINDILDFSKIEVGKVELETIRFDLREYLETTLKTLALRADERGLELLCDINAAVPEAVIGDPGRLTQIVLNLIGNAIKFTTVGEVAIHVHPDTEALEHGIHFTVTDTGIGIPSNKIDSIFESFSQADTSTTRQYGGTGLGLTITKRLIELMGGRIWIRSELGHGSEFHFVVPLAAAEPMEVRPIQDESTSLLKGVKVLVVDDNKTNRRILEGLLGIWGMRVYTAPDAESALAKLVASSAAGEAFQLVLTDMHMPKIDGLMLVQQMQAHTTLAHSTVMMLSSGGNYGDASRCQSLGVAAYLLKPVRRVELQQAIVRALGPQPAQEEKSMITQDTLRAEVPAEQFLRILLAEDNEVNQKLAVRMLQRRGHSVVVACNGRDAVDILPRQSFDLVLMDVQMPILDGIAATNEIRQGEDGTGRHIPIVAMTALVMKGDRERCLAARMDGYISKPIRAQELDAVLDQYSNQKNRLSEADSVRKTSPTNELAVDVKDLLERIDGDRDFVMELLEAFSADYPQKLFVITNGLTTGNHDEVRRAAHGLKGALANLAAVRASALAAELEEMGVAQDLSGAQDTLSKLETELPFVTRALLEICQEPVA